MPLSQLALALLVPLLWGFGFVFAKAGLSEFPPLMLMGMRFSLTALILLPFVRIPRGHLLWIAALAFVGSTVQYGLTFTGLDNMDASLAIIIVQLEVPFGVLMGALIFKEKVGWQRVFGILLAFMGVALIAGMPKEQTALWPTLLVIGGAFTWAVSQIMVKQLKNAVNGFTLIAWVGLLVGLMVLCLQRVTYFCLNKDKKCPGVKLCLSALSKLVTPIVVSACPFLLVQSEIYEQRPGTMRMVHVAVGLCMALLTIKLIVFDMSRQAYAAIQGDGIPIVLAILWIRNDPRIANDGVHLLFCLLTAWYLYRIGSWTDAALTQLCERLQIHLFTISPPSDRKKTN